jgi:hypothetical protein
VGRRRGKGDGLIEIPFFLLSLADTAAHSTHKVKQKKRRIKHSSYNRGEHKVKSKKKKNEVSSTPQLAALDCQTINSVWVYVKA